MARVSEQHVGKPIAVVVGGKVISAPVVRGRFSKRAEVTGRFSREDAEQIVKEIKGSAKAAKTEDAPYWPEFHGPKRDNISPETGLLKKWPEGGPPRLWQYADCGYGYSGVAIAEGRIYTAGDFDDQEMVIALDLDGKRLWKSPNGPSWTGATPGSRTTPTYHEGVVYHMNPTGRLAAYRADSGRELWAADLRERFDAQFGIWAMSENVIVDGDQVLCLPGGTKGLAAALDKHTGKTLWATPGVADKAAYCSPVVGEYRGVRMMVTMTQDGVVAVNVKDGELLWSYPFRRTAVSQNATTPVFHDGYVFVTCGHFTGGQLLKVDDDLRGVSEVWYKREFDNCHGGVVLLDGRLYGCACRLGGKGFFCVDFLTGETIATENTVGKVSIAYADGMLYALNHKGPMYLMGIQPDALEIVSRFDVPQNGRGLYLAHPVICGGRLYLRHDNYLYCYDIRAGS
jgi:outer membrane protein assembly factor BamB